MPAPELRKRPVWCRVEWVGLRDGLPFKPVKPLWKDPGRVHVAGGFVPIPGPQH